MSIIIREETRFSAFYDRRFRRIQCITWENKVLTGLLLKRAFTESDDVAYANKAFVVWACKVPTRTYFWQSRARSRQVWNKTLLRDLRPMYKTSNEAMHAARNHKN